MHYFQTNSQHSSRLILCFPTRRYAIINSENVSSRTSNWIILLLYDSRNWSLKTLVPESLIGKKNKVITVITKWRDLWTKYTYNLKEAEIFNIWIELVFLSYGIYTSLHFSSFQDQNIPFKILVYLLKVILLFPQLREVCNTTSAIG